MHPTITVSLKGSLGQHQAPQSIPASQDIRYSQIGDRQSTQKTSTLQRVFNVMACRHAAVARRWDGWAAQLLSVSPESWEQNSECLGLGKLPLFLERAGPEYPTSKKDLTMDSLFEKSSFIKLPSCCSVSVTLIYVQFAVKSVCMCLLVTREGLCDHLTAMPVLSRRLWSGTGVGTETFKHAPELRCSLVI